VGPRTGLDEKNSQLLPGLEPPIMQFVAQRYTTELSRLSLAVSTVAVPYFFLFSED
jgi:hypothetical protein